MAEKTVQRCQAPATINTADAVGVGVDLNGNFKFNKGDAGGTIETVATLAETQTFTGAKTFSTPPTLTGESKGTASGSGVTATEYPGYTKLTLVNTPIPLVDAAGVVAHGGLKIYTFPAGLIKFAGIVANLALTKSSAGVNADWDGDIGIGSTAEDGDATLATTEQDFVPTTATPQAVAGATTGKCKSTATESGVLFDGTTTAVPVYLNVLVDDADHDVTTTPCNLIFNGTIIIAWQYLGDY